MQSVTSILTNIRRIIKLYDSKMKPVCDQYKLTSIEMTIISFLHNNPGRDTAADIVELRMLSKSNVSMAVENLIRRELLVRKPDTEDRRRIHLSLTAAALPITQEIETEWWDFREQLFRGFNEEEQELFSQFNQRVAENTKNAMERSVQK